MDSLVCSIVILGWFYSHWLLARVVGQLSSDARQTISKMSSNFQTLQNNFDSNLGVHTAFVSMRISDRLETLGMCYALTDMVFKANSPRSGKEQPNALEPRSYGCGFSS